MITVVTAVLVANLFSAVLLLGLIAGLIAAFARAGDAIRVALAFDPLEVRRLPAVAAGPCWTPA